jgi:hypothetical protein
MITEMQFDPVDGLRDVTEYVVTPVDQTAAREQIQGRLDELRDYINDDLIPSIDKRTINAKTDDYTVVAGDLNETITMTGTKTVTLPLTTTGFGAGFRVRVSNVGSGTVTVAATSTDTIAGAASVSLAPGKSIEVVADASGIWTVHGFDFTELISTNILMAAKTVYVAPTGNDSTGDGSSGNPYATINKAISVIPKNLNGSISTTINIAAGTYAETVALRGYHGGRLVFAINGTVNINSMETRDCSEINFSGTGTVIFGTSSNPNVFSVFQSIVTADASVSLSVAGTTGAGAILDASIVSINGTFVIGNNATGIYCRYGASVYIATITGGTATMGIVVQTGSKLSYSTSTYTATTMASTSGGGRIYTGAQA